MSRIFRRNRGVAAQANDPRARRPRRRPALEALEGRQLMATLGPELALSPPNPHSLGHTVSAGAPDGSSVVVWVEEYSPTDHDIYAQRLDPLGKPIGLPIAVDASTIDSTQPAVAMDAQGNFAVTWTNGTTATNLDVMVRYYPKDILSAGGALKVAGSPKHEFRPDVALSQGSLVVSYSQLFTPFDSDIRAHRYSVSKPTGGAPVVTDVIDFGVAIDSDHNESRSSVAMAPDGGFAIAYQFDYSPTDSDIKLSRFAPNGSVIAHQVGLATSGLNEENPDVAMDDFGNAVVAYQKDTFANPGQLYDIKARQVNPSGVVGQEITVREGSSDTRNPSVALARSGGRFAVAYDVFGGAPEVTVVDPQSNARPQTFGLGSGAFGPQVSVGGPNGFLVTYGKVPPGQPPSIFGRRGTFF